MTLREYVEQRKIIYPVVLSAKHEDGQGSSHILKTENEMLSCLRTEEFAESNMVYVKRVRDYTYIDTAAVLDPGAEPFSDAETDAEADANTDIDAKI